MEFNTMAPHLVEKLMKMCTDKTDAEVANWLQVYPRANPCHVRLLASVWARMMMNDVLTEISDYTSGSDGDYILRNLDPLSAKLTEAEHRSDLFGSLIVSFLAPELAVASKLFDGVEERLALARSQAYSSQLEFQHQDLKKWDEGLFPILVKIDRLWFQAHAEADLARATDKCDRLRGYIEETLAFVRTIIFG